MQHSQSQLTEPYCTADTPEFQLISLISSHTLHQTAKAVFNDNNMIVTCIYASVYTHLFSYLLNFYRTLASFHSEYTRGHQEE